MNFPQHGTVVSLRFVVQCFHQKYTYIWNRGFCLQGTFVLYRCCVPVYSLHTRAKMRPGQTRKSHELWSARYVELTITGESLSDHRKHGTHRTFRRTAFTVTLCLYDDLGHINVIAGILKLWKRFRMSQILFEHGINSLPLVCFRGYGNLSTLSIAIPRLAFGRAWYCDAACGEIPVSASANRG